MRRLAASPRPTRSSNNPARRAASRRDRPCKRPWSTTSSLPFASCRHRPPASRSRSACEPRVAPGQRRGLRPRRALRSAARASRACPSSSTSRAVRTRDPVAPSRRGTRRKDANTDAMALLASVGAASRADVAFTNCSQPVHGHVTGIAEKRHMVCGVHTTEQPEVLIAGELEIRPSEHLARARGRTLSLSVRETRSARSPSAA